MPTSGVDGEDDRGRGFGGARAMTRWANAVRLRVLSRRAKKAKTVIGTGHCIL